METMVLPAHTRPPILRRDTEEYYGKYYEAFFTRLPNSRVLD